MSGPVFNGPDSLPPQDAGAARWLAAAAAEVTTLVECQRDVQTLHTLLTCGNSMAELGERIRACAGSLDDALGLLDTMQQQAVQVLELLKRQVRLADLARARREQR